MKRFTITGVLTLTSIMLLSILSIMAGCSKPDPPAAGYYTGPMEGKGKNAAPPGGVTAPGKTGGKMGGVGIPQ